jgi:hypothetical protein
MREAPPSHPVAVERDMMKGAVRPCTRYVSATKDRHSGNS